MLHVPCQLRAPVEKWVAAACGPPHFTAVVPGDYTTGSFGSFLFRCEVYKTEKEHIILKRQLRLPGTIMVDNNLQKPSYQDYADVTESQLLHLDGREQAAAVLFLSASGGNANFPERLHYVLSDMEKDGLDNIASWQSHGRCFVVHDVKRFEKEILPW